MKGIKHLTDTVDMIHVNVYVSLIALHNFVRLLVSVLPVCSGQFFLPANQACSNWTRSPLNPLFDSSSKKQSSELCQMTLRETYRSVPNEILSPVLLVEEKGWVECTGFVNEIQSFRRRACVKRCGRHY